MRVVFDVDGCLIDSRRLIIQAYTEAGVVPPDNILECEGVDWLHARGYPPPTAAEVKARKNQYYLRRITHNALRTLPPYNVACRLATEGVTCYAYTGAPHGTIARLQARLPSWPFARSIDGITTPERMTHIRAVGEGGVYVDDQHRLVDLPSSWRFVHYVSQNADQLYRKIVDDHWELR